MDIEEIKKIIQHSKEINAKELHISGSGKELIPLLKNIYSLTTLETLNLSYNGLSNLPDGISKLANLKCLDLRGNGLIHLPVEFTNMVLLQDLNISYNALTSLPDSIGVLKDLRLVDFSGNRLTQIPESIGELTSLVSFNFNGNHLINLPVAIGKLINVESFDVSGNHLTSLPAEIAKLLNLRRVRLSDNDLINLPHNFVNLTQLEVLDISNNRITALPQEIGKLSKLQVLHASNNQIVDLPTELAHLINLKELLLNGNPLQIPPEIFERNATPEFIINYFFRHATSKKRPINEVKVLLVGQGSVGKTSLVNRLVKNGFDLHENKTDGIEISRWKLQLQKSRPANRKKTRLNIWDFGGQEIMHATHQFFLTRRSLYLLVLDTRLGQEENRVEYWLKVIQSIGGDSPVLIVGNKADQHPLDIDRTGLQKNIRIL